ncbi:hypothetical protein MD484_g7261, partial [Candolleomyces efflorescens]
MPASETGHTSTSYTPTSIYDEPPVTPTQSYTATTTAPKAVGVEGTAERLKKSIRNVMGKEAPLTPTSQDIRMTRPDPLVKERKEMLKTELENKVIELVDSAKEAPGYHFVSALYPNIEGTKNIAEFLRQTAVYDSEKRRWKLPIATEGMKETRMYSPLVTILNEIFKYFLGKKAADRIAVDTHITKLYHKEPVATQNNSSPDISVKARGSSFQLPLGLGGGSKSIGYSNIAAVFEVKLSTQEWSDQEEILQLAVYARQLFIQQPNRHFVRALIVTERSFRLFHFDRSGVQYTGELDIHGPENAALFVRLVLGLCSLKECDIGLDESVEWKVVSGRKLSGTLRARGERDEIVTYSLANVDPTLFSYDLCGRGITSWQVVDPVTGEMLLVRDMWRSESRLSEDFYLELARGLPGIVQMVSFEFKRGETAQFRKYSGAPDPSSLGHNRIATRIILDTHGKSIQYFTSAIELLYALFDTVTGHKQLLLKEALHRQVTLNNIMLGRPGALPGNRGGLIGLDMAKKKGAEACAERHSTTDIHRSITTLKKGKGVRHPLDHSHLDDLESFVYVLAHIMFNYDHTGAPREPFDLTHRWSLMSNVDEAASKEAFLGQECFEFETGLYENWPRSCTKLLMDYKLWLFELNQRKTDLTNMRPSVRAKALEDLMSHVLEDYDVVLAFLDKAIQAIESGDDVIAPPTPDSVASDSSSRGSSLVPGHGVSLSSEFSRPMDGGSDIEENIGRFFSLKRSREEEAEDQREAKRSSSPAELPETPCRTTTCSKLPRTPSAQIKRLLKANLEAARRASAKRTLDEIPEEPEADEARKSEDESPDECEVDDTSSDPLDLL